MFGEILKGMATTLKHLFQPPVTDEYPEKARPVSARFKGRHHLHRYDNGLFFVRGRVPCRCYFR